LAGHIKKGIVIRRKHATDQRAGLLVISPASVKLIGKYAAAVAVISASHFK
jgi:hypothetical protein